MSFNRLQTPTVAVPAVLESGGMVAVKDARCARVRDGRRRGKCGAHAHRRCDYYQRKGCYSIVLVLFMTLFVGARAQCTAVTSNSVGELRNALIPTTGSAPYDKYMNGLQSNSASHTTSVASVPVTISSALHMIHEVDAAKGTVTVFMTHRMSWLDGRLKYCTTSAVPYPKIKFDASFVDEIWTPEYAVPNQISTVQDPQSYATVRGSDGMVYLDTTVGMKLACTLDFKKMPYDSQTCAARVALVQRKDILELKLDDTLPEAFFLETGGMGGTKEWKISKLSATVGETLDNATYVDFTFVMDFTRHSCNRNQSVMLRVDTLHVTGESSHRINTYKQYQVTQHAF